MDVFWLRVLLSFIVGGGYIALSIWVAERFGSKWGGILAGLPSTTLISLLFIGWIQGIDAVRAAIPVMPIGIGLCGVFLVLLVVLRKFGFYVSFIAALGAWFVLTVLFVFIRINDILFSLGLAALILFLVICYFRDVPNRQLPKDRFRKREFLFRAIFSGLIIALAVVLAKFAGPLWGGLFASFPAAYSSAIFFLSKKHGADFAASVSKTLPVGSLGIIGFIIVLYFLLPSFGLLAGIAIAYVFSVLLALIAGKLLKVY